MKKILKSTVALTLVLLMLAICALPVLAASETQGDGHSVSYEQTAGTVTINLGKGEIITWGQPGYTSWASNTGVYTVNGRSAVCAWADASGPAAGTYNGLTKYVLSNTDAQKRFIGTL